MKGSEFFKGDWVSLFFIISLFGVLVLGSFFPLDEPPKELNKTDKSENRSTNLSHPEISECKEIEKEIDRSFCIADVAEIEENVSICKDISGKYIRKFCVARITLNKTKCRNLNDEKLIQSCIESIELKQKWKDQE